MDGLTDLRQRYPQHLSNIRGLGTFCAFDLSSVAKRDEVVAKLKERGTVNLNEANSRWFNLKKFIFQAFKVEAAVSKPFAYDQLWFSNLTTPTFFSTISTKCWKCLNLPKQAFRIDDLEAGFNSLLSFVLLLVSDENELIALQSRQTFFSFFNQTLGNTLAVFQRKSCLFSASKLSKKSKKKKITDAKLMIFHN